MDQALCTFLAGFGLAAALLIPVLLWRRRAEMKTARALLHKAKREVEDMAVLPLHDPYPMMQVDEGGKIVFANPAALRIFPDVREKAVLHPILSGLDPLDAAWNKKRIDAREVYCDNIVYHRTIAPVTVGGRRFFVVYCYDMTAQKETQAALEKSRMEAESANRAKSDFLANMSHELRTPMNGIIGLSGILLDADMPPAQREMVEAVNSSSRNLLTLLNDILDYSKVEAGQLVLENIPYDMRGVVRQIVRLHAAAARAKGLALHCTVAKNVPACLVGDPARLQQVVNNLLGNAIKFTGKGHVRLDIGGAMHARSGKFRLKISVEDTGIGIPENRQQAVFAKFTQADAATSRKFGGTGLGLTITRDLARLMGGDVSLKSAEGAGTTFFVELPAGVGTPAQLLSGAARAEQRGADFNVACRLLIVDDHPVNRLFMRKALLNMGLPQFDEAADGAAALDMCARQKYDIIFMDCQMPDMDGFAVAQAIREKERDGNGHRTVIIAVTANAMVEDEKKCLNSGMDDYISKPVDREKLRQVLKRWLPASKAETPPAAPDRPARQVKTDIMDWSRLNEVTDGDEVMKLRVIDMFTRHAAEDMQALAKGASAESPAQWVDTAHKLYGAAVNMGAYAMASACDAAQKMQDVPPPARRAAYDRILRAYGDVCAALEKRG